MTPSSEERNIQSLLQRAADMPATLDVMPRLRQQLAARHIAPRAPMLARAMPVVCVALIGALVAAGFATFHPKAPANPPVTQQSTATPQPTATPLPPCPIKTPQFTLQALNGYADPSRTSIYFSLMPQIAHYQTSMGNLELLDARGTVYEPNFGGGGEPTSNGALNPFMYFAFQPLPQAELATPQQVTLQVTQMIISQPASQTQPGCSTSYNGEWTSQITVTPHAGKLFTFSAPPVTSHGISVQATSLELADPLNDGIDGLTRGDARLTLRLSGLPTGMALCSLHNMQTEATLGDGTVTGKDYLGPRGIMFVNATYPGDVFVNGTDCAQPDSMLVGPNGTATISVIDYTDAPFTTSNIDVEVTQLDVSPPNMDLNHRTIVNGPWNLTLPLR